jgi:hypothetical protein
MRQRAGRLPGPLTRKAVGRIGSALWPDAPNAAQVQLGMQLGPAANTKETEKG